MLGAGVFHGGPLAATKPSVNYPPLAPELAGRLDRLRALSRQYAVPLPAAALQFPLSHPVVPAVVVGARSPAEITEVAGYLDHEIPPAFWRALEADGLIRLASS
nr:aldo/keto reductase [Kribbella flavida]